jgi:hypothetical protein
MTPQEQKEMTEDQEDIIYFEPKERDWDYGIFRSFISSYLIHSLYFFSPIQNNKNIYINITIKMNTVCIYTDRE